jgi:trehalose-phosphatase
VETRLQDGRPDVLLPVWERRAHRTRGHSREVGHLLAAWPEVVARIRRSDSVLLFLDFDGTLVRLRRRRDRVRLSQRAKRILKRLTMIEKLSVVIISGRDVRNIEKLVGTEGFQYVGLHGAQRGGRSMVLSGAVRKAVVRAKETAKAALRHVSGISVEDKGLSFAVHYRGASRASVAKASHVLERILAAANDKVRLLPGDKVWEFLPRELPGKGSAALELFAAMPGTATAIYFGDDETDEEAFAVLPGQITVKVGAGRKTRANYYVKGPGEVLYFLSRLGKEL